MPALTQPIEGMHFARDGKMMRCILVDADGKACGWKTEHSTRLRSHYSGMGGNARKCKNISPEERKNFCDADVTSDLFVQLASGYARYPPSRARKYAEYYAHDKDNSKVQCLYCDKRMRYNETQMLEHLVSGSKDVPLCMAFPEELRAPLVHHRTPKDVVVDMALRKYIQVRSKPQGLTTRPSSRGQGTRPRSASGTTTRRRRRCSASSPGPRGPRATCGRPLTSS